MNNRETAYKEHIADAEAAFRAGDLDASIRAACCALDILPGEETPTHIIAACQSALRVASGVPVQPAPVFFTNLTLFQLQKESHVFPGSVCPAAGNILYSLVRLLAPRLVIETGTLFGFSCLCLGQALKDNGDGGRLVAFDLFPDKNYPALAPGQTGFEYVSGIVAQAGLSDTITLQQGNSPQTIAAYFDVNNDATVPVPDPVAAKIDLAFIDGDHFIRGCVEDFRAVDKHLAPGGIIVLHDTDPAASGWMGPRFLLERLRDAKLNDAYEVMNLPTTDKLGMALLRKTGNLPNHDWRPSVKELAAEFLLHRKHFSGR